MSVVKSVQVMSESDESWEGAVQKAVKRVSKNIRNIRSVNINNFSAVVENDEIVSWRANMQLTFEVEV